MVSALRKRIGDMILSAALSGVVTAAAMSWHLGDKVAGLATTVAVLSARVNSLDQQLRIVTDAFLLVPKYPNK